MRGATRPVNLVVAVLILVAVAVLAPASPAGAEAPIVCTGTMRPPEPWYDGAETYVTVYGNIVVPKGASCELDNIQLHGNLVVEEGASVVLGIFADRPLILNHIYGNVTIGKDASLGGGYASIDGKLSAAGAEYVSTWTTYVGNIVVTGAEYVQLFRTWAGGTATLINNERLELVEFGASVLTCEGNGIGIIDTDALHRSGQCATDYIPPPP